MSGVRSIGSFVRGRNCDIEINANGSVFSVHSSLLQEHSHVLRKKIALVFGNQASVTVDADEKGFEWCIHFMYTGECPPEDSVQTFVLNDVLSALQAADCLQMKFVRDKCLDFLLQRITPSNSLEVVQILGQYDNGNRLQEAHAYVKANFGEAIEQRVFSTMEKTDFFKYITESDATPQVIWKAITRWMEHESTRKHCLFEALDILLLSNMDITPILAEVISHKMIQKESKLFNRVVLELENRETNLIRNMTVDSSLHLLKFSNANNFQETGVVERLRRASEEFITFHIGNSKVLFNDLGYEEFKQVLRSMDSRNTILWELIASWIKYKEARQTHLLGLIQIMDITILTPNFISTEMRPLINSSNDCLNYILDRLLERTTVKELKGLSQLAICDSKSQLLTLLDSASNTHAEIRAPRTKCVSRITSMDGDLFLLQGPVLSKLMLDGTWEQFAEISNYSHPWTQFIAFRNQLCLISSESLYRYDVMDKTEKCSEGCMMGNGFSSTCSDIYIYTAGGSGTQNHAKSYTTDNGWIDLPTMPIRVSNLASTCFKSKLFVLGGAYAGLKSSSVACFDGKTWTVVCSMLRRRSHFAATVYEAKMIVIGGSSDLIESSDYIEEYNSETNSWKQIGLTGVVEGVLTLGTCKVDTTVITFECNEKGKPPSYFTSARIVS